MSGAHRSMSKTHPPRHRRRRQLRQQPRAGRRVLPRRRSRPTTCPGLMHVELGGYHVRDIEFVAAFDVDADKVGLDLGKAIFAEHQQHDQVRRRPATSACTVQRGPTFDGFGKYYREVVEESPGRAGRRRPGAARRRGRRARVATCPVGSEEAQSYYAQACLDAGVGVRQRHPGVHRQRPRVGRRSSTDAGVPIVGDDIKSQVGATIMHRMLARLFEDRGMAIDHTYQLNFGGNMDFKNMLERERLRVEEDLEDAVGHQPDRPGHRRPTTCTSARPTTCRGSTTASGRYIRLEGRNFGDVPLNVELKLEVWDSPELGRRDHRRRALRQDRPRPRHRRPAARPVGVLHEVARRCSTTTTRPTSMVERPSRTAATRRHARLPARRAMSRREHRRERRPTDQELRLARRPDAASGCSTSVAARGAARSRSRSRARRDRARRDRRATARRGRVTWPSRPR